MPASTGEFADAGAGARRGCPDGYVAPFQLRPPTSTSSGSTHDEPRIRLQPRRWPAISRHAAPTPMSPFNAHPYGSSTRRSEVVTTGEAERIQWRCLVCARSFSSLLRSLARLPRRADPRRRHLRPSLHQRVPPCAERACQRESPKRSPRNPDRHWRPSAPVTMT